MSCTDIILHRPYGTFKPVAVPQRNQPMTLQAILDTAWLILPPSSMLHSVFYLWFGNSISCVRSKSNSMLHLMWGGLAYKVRGFTVYNSGHSFDTIPIDSQPRDYHLFLSLLTKSHCISLYWYSSEQLGVQINCKSVTWSQGTIFYMTNCQHRVTQSLLRWWSYPNDDNGNHADYYYVRSDKN